MSVCHVYLGFCVNKLESEFFFCYCNSELCRHDHVQLFFITLHSLFKISSVGEIYILFGIIYCFDVVITFIKGYIMFFTISCITCKPISNECNMYLLHTRSIRPRFFWIRVRAFFPKIFKRLKSQCS